MSPAPPADWRGASVSADTARMRPGHQDFQRYDPEQCLRAVWHIQTHLYRHGEGDTLRYIPQGDTLPTISIDTGRACSARFHDVSVPTHQLGSLIRLQLAVGEDDRAAATAKRWLALDLSPNDRTWALYRIATANILASPIRIDAVRDMIAKIDSMGPSMNALQFQVHAALLAHWTRQFNTAEIRKESETILSIAERTPMKFTTVEHQLGAVVAITSAFRGYAEVLAYEGKQQALDSLRDRTLAIVGRLEEEWARGMVAVEIVGEKNLSQLVGKPLPPMHPEWTINGGSNPQRPRSGRVTIFVPLLDLSNEVQWNGANGSGSTYAILRRLADRYGPEGLDVVIVTRTKGYSLGSLVQTEEEELKSIEDLYVKFQRISATILVEKTPFQKLPDGRWIPQPTPLMKSLHNGLLLVGRDGMIRWWSYIAGEREAQLEAYVRLLLSQNTMAIDANR